MTAPLGVDDFEDVAVGVLKEKPLEGGLAQRIDQLRAMGEQPGFERREIAGGMEQGDVPAKFALERRGLEILDLDQVNLLAGADFEPGRRPVDIGGAIDGAPEQ